MRTALIASALCVWLIGCAASPPPADLTGEPTTETIWVIERGWHTDIGVEAASISPALADVRAAFPGVRALTFGFGERAYLLRKNHNVIDMLAALLPNPGAVLVTALRVAPNAAFPDGDVVVLHVSERQRAQLEGFIAGALSRGPDGVHRAIAGGPYPGSAFYASTGTYSLTFTCNTWTAEGLQTASLPVRANSILFAGGVMRQARRAAQSNP